MITLGILFKAEGIVHRGKAREPRFAGEDAMRILVYGAGVLGTSAGLAFV